MPAKKINIFTPISVDGEDCYEIELSNGIKTLIDKCDLEKVQKYNWICSSSKSKTTNIENSVTKYYVVSNELRKETGVNLLHRYLLDVKERNMLVDHKNNNSLDNRRKNIRVVTVAENQRGKAIYKNKDRVTSIYRGVTVAIVAKIVVDNVNIYLGKFKTEKEAAIAWNTAAKKYHGENAFQNIIED
jgi:hypothetical protein